MAEQATLPNPFLLAWSHPEQNQLRNSFISPFPAPLITNSAESWTIPNKRQIYLPQDVNKIIRNKHSEALGSWENFNSLTPAFTEILGLSTSLSPGILPAWVICWHTFTSWSLCSHRPIINLSTGALNKALCKQGRKPERNSLFLWWGVGGWLPGTTGVGKAGRDSGRHNCIGWNTLGAKHPPPHWY